ncbi:hypothetical protein [Microcoleus vaginatus]|uniref:hypothetical protein n=1 Tax=Microcoleus vaginatus TaxID=119532 RepID=UPI00403F5B7B
MLLVARRRFADFQHWRQTAISRRGTLTGAIDPMQQTGLFRETDTRDRRIWLTNSGTQLQDVLPPLVAEIRYLAVEGISQG